MSSLTRKIQIKLFEKMGYPRPYKLVPTYVRGSNEPVDIPTNLPWPNVYPKGTMAALINAGVRK